MNLESLINLEDARAKRTPAEFVLWFNAVLTQINESKDKEMCEQILMRRGIAKPFYEELFPLCRLLQRKLTDWGKAMIAPTLGNEKFDVRIQFDGLHPDHVPEFLETTYAFSGQKYKWQMRHFQQYGSTCMTGPVPEEISNANPLKPIPDEARSCDETFSEVSLLLKERIARKSSNAYPKRTGLLIYIEDYGTFMDPKYSSKLSAVMDENDKALRNTFMSSYMILSSNGDISERRYN